MEVITDMFYILILDEDDTIVHRENFGVIFPSAYDVVKLIKQIAGIRKDDPTLYTGKIDKRTAIINQ